MTIDTMPLLYAQDAEESLLGAVIASQGEVFPAVRAMLKADDFWSRRHRLYWQMFERLADQDLPTDLTLVRDEMMRLGKDDLELSGGPAYVMHLISNLSVPYNPDAYARQVLEMSVRRQAVELLDKKIGRAHV